LPDQEDTLLEWAEAGVAGLVPREASFEDLLCTVGHAVRGEFRCSPRFAGRLLQRLAQPRLAAHPPERLSSLTARETEIIRLIDQGLSNKAIAVELGIELATVKNHVHNLLEKLHVHRRAEAAARIRRGDVDLAPTHHPARTD
jgi:DNA-binding NarL/FixJ family response regulator